MGMFFLLSRKTDLRSRWHDMFCYVKHNAPNKRNSCINLFTQTSVSGEYAPYINMHEVHTHRWL
jgi:hypothetical protein